MPDTPKILFVAMSNSVHTARWLNELKDTGWDIHLFSSSSLVLHPMIKNVTLHGAGVSDKIWLYHEISDVAREKHRVNKLISVIKSIKPDIIHSLETQYSGYLMLKVREKMKNNFPTWIHTPWGSDIYFFGRFPEHAIKIKKILSLCDYYGPKSKRDVQLAKEFGFKGKFLPVLPGNGGLDVQKLGKWQKDERKIILVKGYQGVINRALVALRVIELCADILKDYTIIVYSIITEDVQVKIKLMQLNGINIFSLPPQPHEVMLSLYGRSRVSISLNISDGVPNSLLESMVMGTFPIESNTGCANEWIVDGETGFIVPPEDPEYVAKRLRMVIEDNELVNRVVGINHQVALQNFDKLVIHPKIIKMYTEIFEELGAIS